MARFQLPEKRREANQILEELEARSRQDLPWQDGRVFAYIYRPEADLEALTRAAYSQYLLQNPLDPTVFPSLGQMESELLDMTLELMHAPESASGTFSQGGTESIMLAMKSAREQHRNRTGRASGAKVLLGSTAHPSFHKAAEWLDLELQILPVDPESCALNPIAVKSAISSETALVVASAPSFPQGIVDPVPELAAIAKRHQVPLHVDACVGGFYLPFVKDEGIPAFDFRCEGVTSMSLDFHKNAYSPKGASAVLFRSREYQLPSVFASSNWTGYPVANKTVLSSRSAGSMAAAWAALNFQGREGLTSRVRQLQEASTVFKKGVEKLEGVSLQGNPLLNLFSLETSGAFDCFELSDHLRVNGFHTQQQFSCGAVSEAIHVSINRDNIPQVEPLLKCLRDGIKQQKDNPEWTSGSNPQEIFDSVMEGKGLPERRAALFRMLNQLPSVQRDDILRNYLLN